MFSPNLDSEEYEKSFPSLVGTKSAGESVCSRVLSTLGSSPEVVYRDAMRLRKELLDMARDQSIGSQGQRTMLSTDDIRTGTNDEGASLVVERKIAYEEDGYLKGPSSTDLRHPATIRVRSSETLKVGPPKDSSSCGASALVSDVDSEETESGREEGETSDEEEDISVVGEAQDEVGLSEVQTEPYVKDKTEDIVDPVQVFSDVGIPDPNLFSDCALGTKVVTGEGGVSGSEIAALGLSRGEAHQVYIMESSSLLNRCGVVESKKTSGLGQKEKQAEVRCEGINRAHHMFDVLPSPISPVTAYLEHDEGVAIKHLDKGGANERNPNAQDGVCEMILDHVSKPASQVMKLGSVAPVDQGSPKLAVLKTHS
ncbi:hypothetical protein U1Q18_006794, partial [Sarracenia purpurea var. burkii]